MPDAFDSSTLGPDQVPFLYARPDWLKFLEPEPGEASLVWLRLVSHVANTANESGFLAPTHAAWLLWSGLTINGSLRIAEEFERAGGLRRTDGNWYVAGWRDVYRVPDSV